MNKQKSQVFKACLAGVVGYPWAIEMINFVNIWEDMPSVEQILQEPDKDYVSKFNAMDKGKTQAIMLMMADMVVANIAEADLEKGKRAIVFSAQLPQEVQSYLLKNLKKKQPSIITTTEYMTVGKGAMADAFAKKVAKSQGIAVDNDGSDEEDEDV